MIRGLFTRAKTLCFSMNNKITIGTALKKVLIIHIALCFILAGIINFYIYVFSSQVDLSDIYDKYKPMQKMIDLQDKNIFFVENTRGYLSAKQACAVEAAARNNPEYQVTVFFIVPITNTSFLTSLSSLKNIKYAYLKMVEFAQKSPLRRVINRNNNLHENADVMRFLLLQQYGGLVLDLEAMVVQPLRRLGPNWVTKISPSYMSADPIALSRNIHGREIAEKAIQNLITRVTDIERNMEVMDNLRNEIITKTLKDFCRTSFVPEMDTDSCPGIAIYREELFPNTIASLFSVFTPESLDIGNTFILSMRTLSRQLTVRFNKHYPALAQKFCPICYEKTNGTF